MTRRSITLTISGFLIVALIGVAALFPVPYVVYQPGPTGNTLGEFDGEPVVQIDGAETFVTDGELDLTTVALTPPDAEVDLLSALVAWADDKDALIPRETIYPEGTTANEQRERNQQLMTSSSDTAKAAALRKLDHKVPAVVVVSSLDEGAPAEGELELGDVIIAVDGTEVKKPQDVIDAVTVHDPGDEVEFEVERSGEPQAVAIETIAAEDDGRAIVGAGLGESFDFPVDIEINIDPNIGGPSAGMIFALAIYDTLTPGAMLDGQHVAGTGTIGAGGDVGPIGGIQQKIAAASGEGAQLFLAPVENCDEAKAAPNENMWVVPIDNLDDAVKVVENYVAGKTDKLPACE